MNDIQTHLEKIRSDAAECVLLSNLVGDGKGEVFARTAKHLSGLALEIEKTIAKNSADEDPRGQSVNMARAGDRQQAVATDIAKAPHPQAVRPRRMLPWLLVIVLGGIVGAFFWRDNPAKVRLLHTSQSKHEAPPAPEDPTKQARATLSGEQADRKILTEQLSALAARVDHLATAQYNLKTALAEIAGPPKSVGVEEKPPVAETKPSAPEEKPVRRDQNLTSALESPAAARQSNGVPPATTKPLSEPDRVGAIAVPPRPAELDPRKFAIGPSGCTHFRSFDPVSGTYTTLDGRRRECRQ